MRYEWDPKKDKTNRRKHGIDFDTASLVFDDPLCISFVERECEGEERWHAIGSIEGIIVVVVVHTWRQQGPEEVVRIIQHARQHGVRKGCMSKLTAEKRRHLQRLASKPDFAIDLSDIPEIRELPQDYVVGKYYKPKKATVTMRLDADVLAWLRSSGEGYQTRINAYLRRLMLRNRNRTSR